MYAFSIPLSAPYRQFFLNELWQFVAWHRVIEEILVQFLVILIPVALIVAGTSLIAAVALLLIRRGRLSDRRSPLTKNLLRAPGHSLRMKIEAIDEELLFVFLIGISIPLFFYSTHLSQSYLAGVPESLLRTGASVVVSIGILVCSIFRLVSLARRRKIAVLGLEGELATAEELNQLMLDGCRVFHDVPFPYGNIDHVVVSQSGVFTVNSKTLGKLRDHDTNAAVVADQQRGVVHFPDRDYRIPTKQFDTERNWLNGYLTSAVGEQVNAESILALPGWFVKDRIGRGSVYVINPYKPKMFFIHARVVLEPALVQRISHQLEQLCRDVEPSFVEKRKRWEDQA